MLAPVLKIEKRSPKAAPTTGDAYKSIREAFQPPLYV